MTGYADFFAEPEVQGPQELAPPKNPYKEFFAEDAKTPAKATVTANAYSDISPEVAARSARIAKELGIPQQAVETDPNNFEKQAVVNKNNALVEANPILARWVEGNPDSARIAQNEFDKLGVLEKLSQSLLSGAYKGNLGDELGRLGHEKQLAAGKETPEADKRIKEIQGSIRNEPELHGFLGHMQEVSAFSVGLVQNLLKGALPGAGVGAAAGAPVGAAAGGVGAIPGAMIGAGIGGTIGMNADMGLVAAGNQYLKMSEMKGIDGQPMSETGKQLGALFTGLMVYATGAYAGPVQARLMGKTSEKLAQEAMAQAAKSPIFVEAVKSIPGKILKGGLHGGAIMVVMETANVIGEEIGKIASEGKFETNPAEVVTRMKDAFINGALLFGTVHTGMRGIGLYGDLKASRLAESRAANLKEMVDRAADTKLRESDPDGFRDFIQKQTEGQPTEDLYIPAEIVRELYQSAKFDPLTGAREADPMFKFVPDMAEQLREAEITGGDVVIKTADFVTHLAGSPLAEKLMPDLRIGADSMSLRDKALFDKERQDRIKQAIEDASKAVDDTSRDERQKIFDTIKQQAMEAGRPEREANKYATLFMQRYAARGERLGIDTFEAYKQANIEVVKAEEKKATEKVTKDEQTQAIVDARKRHSVLNSLLECMAT